MTREDFHDYVAAFQRGDFPGFTKYYADDVRLSLASGARVLVGRPAIESFYRDVFRRIREELEILYLVIDENGVAAEIKTEFFALEDWPDFMVRPMRKGERARIVSYAHYTLRDGKFVDIRSVRYAMW
jgi:hypothetical protein